ncbi:MerR family Zn(II)-responsive transcriptional regulator of zntA [Streptomyces sp. CG 926]|uniref:MerR family transcriptional regulator n=1 Tax=Streptomyces sp. CG 926 TaxID=1882405 RepID=UPI000D6BE4C1|nr:MerR family transcriptional regulator [Streptomyces sp. CG 926]PWK64051.1 MerR family Zn(II)-responsive transcriptional regulator of zntA [Streptomyces sp. CG 926]
MSAGLRSEQVAEVAGVEVQTLRHSERRGLPAGRPGRGNGGHRLYGEYAVTALRVIQAARRLGFTPAEVAALLEVGRHRHDRPVAGFQRRAAAELAGVGAKIADLTTIRTAPTPAPAVEAGCDGRRGALPAARLRALAQGAIGSCRLCSVRR